MANLIPAKARPAANRLTPVAYIPYGSGPMPLLGEPRHSELIRFLQE